MLTLSACGKKNLEEYFNTDTMQKLVTSSVEQYESQGMELACTPRAMSCTTISP
ncbi:MAG: hypothetical protein ACLT5P_04245 [Flavonifractor plautii]